MNIGQRMQDSVRMRCWALACCLVTWSVFAAAADEPAQDETAVEAPAGDAPVEQVTTGGSVITPAGDTKAAPRAAGGPSIEMITGGNSADGAAKVGRLPVLD